MQAKSSYSQRANITLTLNNVSVKKLIDKIENNTQFEFVYQLKDVDLNRIISINAKEEKIATVLNKVFSSTETTFNINDKRIYLIKRVTTQPEEFEEKNRIKAQATGTLKGNVYDAEHPKELLVGATVQLEGTSWAKVTDFDGRFEFNNLPQGKYTVIIRYIGFKTIRIQDVEITANNISEINVAMNASADALNEVIVKADVNVKVAPIRNSTEQSLISEIQSNSIVVTGISNQQISKSVDRNAANVVKRVPGVTVLNNFVLIRGMDPRYTLTYLNNTIAPSSEKNSRRFSFDLVPSGVLDQIMIYKSPAPELPGQFAGGVVKVKTKDAGAVRRLQINYSSQYRTGSSLSSHFGNSGSGNDGFLALDYKNRLYDERLYVPSYNFPSIDRFPSVNEELTRNFPKPYNLTKESSDLDQRIGINYYDSWKLGSTRLNNLTSVSYTDQFRRYENDFTILLRANSDESVDRGSPELQIPEAQYTDDYNRQNVRLNVLQNLKYKINSNHIIDFNGYFNRSIDDETTVRDGYKAQDSTNIYRSVNYEYSVRDVASLQLNGEHRFKKHQVDWYAGTTSMQETTPDLQTYEFTKQNETEYGYTLARTTGDRETRRGSFETDESGIIAGLDYKTTLKNEIKIKAGGQIELQERLFQSFYYFPTYQQSSGYDLQFKMEKPWENMDKIYNDSLITGDPKNTLYLQRDFSEGRYSVDYKLYAGYGGVEVPMFNKKLQVNAGVRYERTDRRLYDALDRLIFTSQAYDNSTGEPKGDTLASPIKSYWLPSASVIYKLNKKMKLKATYGKTLDRPSFRELSNFIFAEYETSTRTFGNPALVDAEINNFDLRWEWYPNPSEFIAVGVFYKDMKNIIEVLDNTNPASQSGFTSVQYTNSDEAYTQGIEVEARKNLGFIPWSPMQYFSVIANYTYLDNEVKGLNRPFFGSTPYTLNTGLYFDQPKWGTNFSVLLNSIGQRLLATGVVQERGNQYQTENTQLDIVFSQQITKYLKFKAGAENILNQAITTYVDANSDGKFTPGVVQKIYGVNDNGVAYDKNVIDYQRTHYKPGTYFTAGFTLEF
ncbi:TonB-dependent receptor [Pseudotamlana agarivorans]|uniref:TonB-dependent receptor n=1 Tax=Pseudotamlana agarivorans TaxID=481183 RepID=UPI00082D9D7A|nr:TonB-dependent receptor [Tamlana agarivorans]